MTTTLENVCFCLVCVFKLFSVTTTIILPPWFVPLCNRRILAVCCDNAKWGRVSFRFRKWNWARAFSDKKISGIRANCPDRWESRACVAPTRTELGRSRIGSQNRWRIRPFGRKTLFRSLSISKKLGYTAFQKGFIMLSPERPFLKASGSILRDKLDGCWNWVVPPPPPSWSPPICPRRRWLWCIRPYFPELTRT